MNPMKQKIHKELKELERDMLEMGEHSTSMLRDGMKAFVDLDPELADDVNQRKGKLTKYDETIEEETLRYLTLFQPVAKDMRKTGGILKIISYLQRIGRYGKDIANIASEIYPQEHISKLVTIPNMAKEVSSMINDALKAFETKDVKLIENMTERDNSIDAQRYSIFREAVSYMMEKPKSITQCAHYIMVSRYLERCADHACKIAEKAYFLATGERKEIS